MVDIDTLTIRYFENDKPVPYMLKCGVEIKISPIRVENWTEFEMSLPILKIEKNDTSDVDIIQMSYLAFLNHIGKHNELYSAMLCTVLRLSLGFNDIQFHELDNKVTILNVTKDSPYQIIEAKEFDEIRKIILFQNIYDYDDTYLSADIRKAIEEYNKVKYGDVVSPSLMKKKIFTMSKTGASEYRINKMHYRTFSQLFKTLVDNDIYFANKLLEASPKYDIKEASIHPMFVKDIDKINDAFTSKSSIENKVGSVT